MGDLAEQIGRQRITHELIMNLDIEERKARSLVESGIFDRFTLVESLNRLRLLVKTLGNCTAGVVIASKPSCISYNLEHLPERLEDLIKAGHNKQGAIRILSSYPEIAEIDDRRFRSVLDALRLLLPEDEIRLYFSASQAAVYLLPPEYLRDQIGLQWEDDVERFWVQLCSNLSSVPKSVIPGRYGTLVNRLHRPEVRAVYDHIYPITQKDRIAAQYTLRLETVFGENLSVAMETFRTNGWSWEDVVHLLSRESNRAWRNNPRVLFAVESALKNVGLEPSIARKLTIRYQLFSLLDLSLIPSGVEALRQAGLGEHLVQIAERNPRALFANPEHVRLWAARMEKERKDPIRYLHTLTRRPIKRASKKAPDQNDLVRKPKPRPTVIADAPVLEPSSLISPAPVIDDRTPKKLKPEEPPAPRSRWARFTPGSVFKIQQPIVAPPPKERALPKKRYREFETEESHVSVDNHFVDWIAQFKSAVMAPKDDEGLEAWSENKWERFRNTVKHAWILDPSGPLPKAIAEIVSWFGASSLRANDSKLTNFVKRVLGNEELISVFAVPAETLHYRIGVLRLYIERDFLEEPELLLRPWERITQVELKFRVFEVLARGKSASKKPYLSMLLEPTRERFLARLNKQLTGLPHPRR